MISSHLSFKISIDDKAEVYEPFGQQFFYKQYHHENAAPSVY